LLRVRLPKPGTGMIKDLSRFAIKYGLIPAIYAIMRIYFYLIRVRSVGENKIMQHLHRGGKGIAALWHQRILLALTYAQRFREFTPLVMISQSRDGDIIAEICRLLNFRPVRGSSSRGGREALAAMVTEFSVHQAAIHAVDGPQGPRGIIKSGLIRMAQLSAVPIVPLTISVNRAWILKSWDSFLIPKPFSTIFVRWDDLLPVPETLHDIAFETVRREIEKKMRENQAEDDKKAGWPESLL
jgi:lysophospholipid acyltransferase (LPLAT)-like uncharacterized protein